MKKRNLVTEAHIEEACTRILELDGWRSFKMEQNFSEKKLKSVGEPGMPDRLYMRPTMKYPPSLPHSSMALYTEVFWVEWKRLRGKSPTKASQHQKDWHALARKQGALTYIAGEDFPATIEGFREFYKSSGLMRRQILS